MSNNDKNKPTTDGIPLRLVQFVSPVRIDGVSAQTSFISREHVKELVEKNGKVFITVKKLAGMKELTVKIGVPLTNVKSIEYVDVDS